MAKKQRRVNLDESLWARVDGLARARMMATGIPAWTSDVIRDALEQYLHGREAKEAKPCR